MKLRKKDGNERQKENFAGAVIIYAYMHNLPTHPTEVESTKSQKKKRQRTAHDKPNLSRQYQITENKKDSTQLRAVRRAVNMTVQDRHKIGTTITHQKKEKHTLKKIIESMLYNQL